MAVEEPAELEHAMSGGRLHTRDVGFMNEQGWFYAVDRNRDMMNASRFRVCRAWRWRTCRTRTRWRWSRRRSAFLATIEVRPSRVREPAARRYGHHAGEFVAFCKEQIAACTSTRAIDVVAELPKSEVKSLLREAVWVAS